MPRRFNLSSVCGRSVQAVPVARSMMAAVPGQAFSSGGRPRSRSPSVCNATSDVERVSEDACQDQAVCRPSEVGRDENRRDVLGCSSPVSRWITRSARPGENHPDLRRRQPDLTRPHGPHPAHSPVVAVAAGWCWPPASALHLGRVDTGPGPRAPHQSWDAVLGLW